MKILYLLVLLFSFIIPFIYSFEKKMQFIKYWKIVFSSITITAILFIFWDVIFTKLGVWGFNPKYYLGITIFDLPLEEILFFILIPYASIFIHYSLLHFYPKLQCSTKFVRPFTLLTITLLIILSIFNINKLYTFVNSLFLIMALLVGFFDKNKVLNRFYISFLVIIIPFTIVNGILTGSFIDEPIVWYNNNETLGIRVFTIPIEDFGYAFSMLFISTYLIEKFKPNTKNA